MIVPPTTGCNFRFGHSDFETDAQRGITSLAYEMHNVGRDVRESISPRRRADLRRCSRARPCVTQTKKNNTQNKLSESARANDPSDCPRPSVPPVHPNHTSIHQATSISHRYTHGVRGHRRRRRRTLSLLVIRGTYASCCDDDSCGDSQPAAAAAWLYKF